MVERLNYLKQKIMAYRPDHPDRIAIIIKTINRPKLLFPTLDLILNYADVPFRLYIGDDGKIDPVQEEIYDLLRKAGHFVRIYDRPLAFTAALNDLSRATEGEGFILRMDDDMGFCEETRVSVLLRLLELVPSLGVIGGAERDIQLRNGKRGKLRLKQGFLVKKENTLYRLIVAPSDLYYTTINGYRLAIVGNTTNFLLIRRIVLEHVSWNEGLWARGEHMDFSLRLAKAGWLIGFTPDCVHEHREDGVPTEQYTGRNTWPDIALKHQLLYHEYGIQLVQTVNFPSSGAKLNSPPHKRLPWGVAAFRRWAGSLRQYLSGLV